jgi:MFS family permease
MRTLVRPLRLPGFGRLTGAYVVNEVGNWLGEIALAILVFDQTGSPLATAALFLAIQFLPAFLGPPLVSRLEAIPSRRSLAGLYATEAAAFAALGLLAEDFVLAAVIVLAAFDGTLALAARSLTRATAAAILAPAGMLRDGNAVFNVGFTASAAVGPALAGLIVAGADVQVALFADAASFLLVSLVLVSARGLPEVEFETATWMERLRDGFRYVRERPALRRLLGAQGAAFVFFFVVIPIEVVFAKETLDAGDAGYGALLSSWGAGMVAGSLMFAALRRLSLRVLLALSTLAVGCGYLGTGVAPTLLVACAASVVGGAGNGVQWVALVSAVQELTTVNYQARVIAMLESLSSAMPGIGFVIGGVVATLLSPRASFLVAGAGVLLVLVIATIALNRIGWRGDQPPEAPVPKPDAPPVPAGPV